MAYDRDLEKPRRREEDLGSAQLREEERENLQDSEQERREDAAKFTTMSAVIKEALDTGNIDDARLHRFEGDERAALEALAVAKSGSETGESRSDFNYVSAPERMRLLNSALAELQPYLAASQSSESEKIHRELDNIRSLISETRHAIKQRILLETAKDPDPESETELDSDDDDESQDEDDKGKKGIVAGFGALLAGARRREKAKKATQAKKKPKERDDSGTEPPEGEDGGSSL